MKKSTTKGVDRSGMVMNYYFFLQLKLESIGAKCKELPGLRTGEKRRKVPGA
jgi:hypothetical protein